MSQLAGNRGATQRRALSYVRVASPPQLPLVRQAPGAFVSLSATRAVLLNALFYRSDHSAVLPRGCSARPCY
eukprot:5903084-Pyramimonas_sp.AAC.1